MYGGPPEATPFLGSLARDGAVFTDVVAAAPWTRAASTALLTGHHPLSIGMVEPGSRRNEHVLPDAVTTLAEHLRAQGWATAGLTTNPNLNQVYGFDQGFDAYRQLEHLWRDDRVKLPGEQAVGLAAELLGQLDPERPFFLMVVLVDTHAPHTASEPARAPFVEQGVPDNVVAYRATLRRFDRAVEALAATLPEHTVLAVVNDHGEGLGWPEHHGKSHGRYLAPSAVGGVFVVRGPGVVPGREIGGLVSQVDVAPTLAGLVGAPLDGTAGLDWSEQLRGRAEATTRDRAFTDTWFCEVSRAAVYTPDRACQRDWTGHADAFRAGCFDRRADPEHARPGADPELEAELESWRAERLAEGARFGAAAVAEPDEGLNAQLEALGYTRGDE